MKKNQYSKVKSTESNAIKSPSQLLQHLEDEITAGKIAPTYIIFANENFIIDEILSLLKEFLLTPGFEPFDFDNLHCGDIEVENILAKVFTPPAASAKRLIIIKDILRLSTHNRTELLTGVAKPRDFSCVVLATEWEKDFADLVKKFKGQFAIYNFFKPFINDLKERIRKWALQNGMFITNDAIEMLLEIAGESSDVLKEELEKISLLVGPGKRITEETIKTATAKARDYQLNELTRAIGEQDLEKALKVLLYLSEWGEEPVKIIGWTGNELFRLLRILDLKRNKIQVAKEFGLRERSLRLSGLMRCAERWTKKSLNKCLVELAIMDKAIKKGHPEPYFLLEYFLIKNLESA
ncbi:MAG: DNA polymerase III subunit delta [bacterium]